ncbi:hypothetical protein [Polyangium jinanense]|uniref:Uncharacterized protein n=1 Tax=Polyangium jinanense TaxID=2829994 RepID=A0A9X3XAG7_9BACT|nr:hypothetical protein [Polyangium jinanense]MDC3956854.1 hypothetical protein [Polyangium jinanense]MDC3987117.1 hypothetical protein [Polyangium jinanense]
MQRTAPYSLQDRPAHAAITYNDCDGIIDDDNPGGGVACTTPLPGICASGTLQCAPNAPPT